MSSIWWLGWNCMLGLGAKGHTARNLLRERECVINLPSSSMVEAVNRMARLTGSDPVPAHKTAMGYTHEKDKLSTAGLTACASALVKPNRVAECPLQMEAVCEAVHDFGHRPDKAATALAFEMRIVRVYVDDAIAMKGTDDRIDPDKWRPLMMSFCQFYGLGARLQHSTLGEIPEAAYRPAAHIQR